MVRMIGGKTQLIGIIGWPVEHSFSPAMHNAAAADLGLDLVYLPLPVRPDQLAQGVSGLVALGFRGANVTVPHKETVIPLLDHVDPAAAAIGAVNTIVVGDRWAVDSGESSAFSSQHPAPDPRLFGYNTDWSGFLAHVRGLGLEIANQDILVLGAGGSSRAVAYALASSGGHVHLFARRKQQAVQIVSELARHCSAGSLAAHDWNALREADNWFSDATLVVNTTPVGMAPQTDESPWPEELQLPEQAFVYDLVYNPAETKFMKQARAAGRRASNGLGMLLRQGALAFELWTGLKPDLEVMAQSLQIEP
ncbi:MAG: shikimate dehydrogenase [Chloroflexota bacterium]|nr:MAG: shikimate dehydrogenase [Chloroflexota bacterium]